MLRQFEIGEGTQEIVNSLLAENSPTLLRLDPLVFALELLRKTSEDQNVSFFQANETIKAFPTVIRNFFKRYQISLPEDSLFIKVNEGKFIQVSENDEWLAEGKAVSQKDLLEGGFVLSLPDILEEKAEVYVSPLYQAWLLVVSENK